MNRRRLAIIGVISVAGVSGYPIFAGYSHNASPRLDEQTATQAPRVSAPSEANSRQENPADSSVAQPAGSSATTASETDADNDKQADPLFAEPTIFGTNWRNARDQASQYIYQFDIVPITRSRVVMNNADALLSLVSQLRQDPNDLSESFELGLFPDLRCEISSIESINGRLVSEDFEIDPGDLRVRSRCGADNGLRIHANIDVAESTMHVSVSGDVIGYQLSPMSQTGYSLVLALDTSRFFR